MKYLSMKKNIIAALVACSVGYVGVSSAHEVPNVLIDDAISDDGGAINKSKVFIAFLSCHDDGGGSPDHLIVRIRDKSLPVAGLMVSVQVVSSRGDKADSVTDTVSGDADFSPSIKVQDGFGPYKLIVDKTDVGARLFDFEYHCNAADGVHTGTGEIGTLQVGLPRVDPQ